MEIKVRVGYTVGCGYMVRGIIKRKTKLNDY